MESAGGQGVVASIGFSSGARRGQLSAKFSSTSAELDPEEESQQIAAAVRLWDEDFLPAWRAAAVNGGGSSTGFSGFGGFPGFGTRSPSSSSSSNTDRSPSTPSGKRSTSPIAAPSLPLSMSVPESLGMLSGFGLGKSSSGTCKAARRHVEEACFQGIPPSVRPRAWPALVGNRLRISAELFAMLRSKADEVRFVTATPEEEEQSRARQFLISAEGAKLQDNRERIESNSSFEEDGYATLGSEYENESGTEDEENEVVASTKPADSDEHQSTFQQVEHTKEKTNFEQDKCLGTLVLQVKADDSTEVKKSIEVTKSSDSITSDSAGCETDKRSNSFHNLRVDTTRSSSIDHLASSQGKLQDSLSKLPSDSELASTLAHLQLSKNATNESSGVNNSYKSEPLRDSSIESVPSPPLDSPPPLPTSQIEVETSAKLATSSSASNKAAGVSEKRSPLDKVCLVRKTSISSQIEQDLSRTFPRLAFFAEGGGPFRAALQEILESYALLRPGLGYVQGMSHVAAMLLLHLERDAAFQAFCNVLEDHVFFNMVRSKDNSMLEREFRLFELLLEDQLPRLSEHFKRIELQPEMFLLDWLLTIFTKALPLDVAARLWDCYLFYDTRERKERFLWRAIIALLKLFEIQLLLLDLENCAQLLRIIPAFDIDKYFHVLRGINLTSSKCASLRKKAGLAIAKFYSIG